jgi:hypothetical protein
MRQGDGPASRALVGEVFDSLQPISPCLSKKARDGWVLALLHRPDWDMAHAFATAHQHPLWIRQGTAEEEAEIHMGFKDRDVEKMPTPESVRRYLKVS